MNHIKKLFVGAAASALMMTSAHAALMNIGGVMIDPLSGFDFSATTATIFQQINTTTGTLSGYGVITRINNTGVGTFCPGCELTFVFDGYTPTTFGAVPTVGGIAQTFNYTGGSVRLYRDFTPDTAAGDTLTLITASDGALWLNTAGHADQFGNTLIGTSTFTTTRTLVGVGSLDVIGGGLADPYLNTNTRPLLPGPGQVQADLSFSTSFTTFPTNVPTFAFGTGNLDGDTIVPVPEPASLSLLGLGFAGIAALRRRKGKAA